jgi:putative addiction module component
MAAEHLSGRVTETDRALATAVASLIAPAPDSDQGYAHDVNAKSAALRTAGLSLPTEERAVLAVELLASLDEDVSEDDPAEVDRAWHQEMVRRSQQVTSGEVKSLRWSEVLEQVAANRNSR